jgi:hypothetical protein
MLLQRFKYYSIWKLTEASVVNNGLGYNGKQKTESGEIVHKFNKIECCVIRKIEFETSPKIKIQVIAYITL